MSQMKVSFHYQRVFVGVLHVLCRPTCPYQLQRSYTVTSVSHSSVSFVLTSQILEKFCLTRPTFLECVRSTNFKEISETFNFFTGERFLLLYQKINHWKKCISLEHPTLVLSLLHVTLLRINKISDVDLWKMHENSCVLHSYYSCMH